MKLPSELPADSVTAICDRREQCALDLSPLRIEAGSLATGDYSVRGLQHMVAVERKSAEDLLGCIGRERERFDREIQRLLAFPHRLIVVESSWQFFEAGDWRGQVTPAQAIGSLIGWLCAGVPIVMCGDHDRAGRFVAKFLYCAARRRLREARSLVEHVTADEAREAVA